MPVIWFPTMDEALRVNREAGLPWNQIADIIGVDTETVKRRARAIGFDVGYRFNIGPCSGPVSKHSPPVNVQARNAGLTPKCVQHRLKDGWSLRQALATPSRATPLPSPPPESTPAPTPPKPHPPHPDTSGTASAAAHPRASDPYACS